MSLAHTINGKWSSNVRWLAIAAACLGTTDTCSAEAPVQRGSYLVNAVMSCAVCHTPRGPSGPLADKHFAGGSVVFDDPSYTVRGSNITPDAETGIGSWTDTDIKRALTDGVRPDGKRLASIMPHDFYKVLTERDLAAIVAYLRSVPAVRNIVAAPVYKGPLPVLVIPGGNKAMSEVDLATPLARGFYLANLAHCMECHARREDGVHDFSAGLGRGGHVMQGPWGAVVVRNITSHPTAGLGGWSDDEIRRALTHSVARDGRKFQPPMARAAFYSRMTPDDIAAVVAYVRALPPRE